MIMTTIFANLPIADFTEWVNSIFESRKRAKFMANEIGQKIRFVNRSETAIPNERNPFFCEAWQGKVGFNRKNQKNRKNKNG